MSYLHCKVLVFNFMNLTFTMLCLNDKLKKKRMYFMQNHHSDPAFYEVLRCIHCDGDFLFFMI